MQKNLFQQCIINRLDFLVSRGIKMFLIVGLGNPGLKYKNTKHNVGFIFADELANELGAKINTSKFNALIAQTSISGEKCIIMKPQTYMNNSGLAVAQATNFYKIPPENVLVVFDDISLEPGKLRIRRKGSSGGHNGIKSIIEHIKSQDFPRIKLGIGGKPCDDYSLADFVLSKIDKKDGEQINKAINDSIKASKLIVRDEIERAMNLYNS